jgi:N-methylhydantoinase A
LREEGFDERDVVTNSAVDICYRGQSSELTVPLEGSSVTTQTVSQAIALFEDEYERTYGHRGETRQFDIVNARMVATVPRLGPNGARWADEPGTDEQGTHTRQAYFGRERGLMTARVVARGTLAAGALQGPLIVQEYDATVVAPPGCTVSLDEFGNIVIDVAARTRGATEKHLRKL